MTVSSWWRTAAIILGFALLGSITLHSAKAKETLLPQKTCYEQYTCYMVPRLTAPVTAAPPHGPRRPKAPDR